MPKSIKITIPIAIAAFLAERLGTWSIANLPCAKTRDLKQWVVLKSNPMITNNVSRLCVGNAAAPVL